MKPRHRRLALVAAGLTLASAGVTLALGAFRSNLVFFVTPTQIAAGQAERGALLRVGGLVQPGSIARDAADMFQNSTLFGTSLPLVKTVPKTRGCVTFVVRNSFAVNYLLLVLVRCFTILD